MERTESSACNPNIEQKKAGVKKEQVKGCGSVNRPTPGSQRPAEPVATGLLQGVKTSKNRGQFSGLGVKLWVVGARFSHSEAILYGVTIGVGEFSCFRQGKQSAWLYVDRTRRGAPPAPPAPCRGSIKWKNKPSFLLAEEGTSTSKIAPQ